MPCFPWCFTTFVFLQGRSIEEKYERPVRRLNLDDKESKIQMGIQHFTSLETHRKQEFLFVGKSKLCEMSIRICVRSFWNLPNGPPDTQTPNPIFPRFTDKCPERGRSQPVSPASQTSPACSGNTGSQHIGSLASSATLASPRESKLLRY